MDPCFPTRDPQVRWLPEETLMDQKSCKKVKFLFKKSILYTLNREV